jgi:hypothetical protein
MWISSAKFRLVMFKLKADAFECVAGGRRGEGAEMKSFDRSSLARALMTGVASLAFVMMGVAGVRAEIVTVQGDDGPAGANGVNPGDNGMPGDDGESVSASAGSAQPVTAPLNKATAAGGNGGAGGNGDYGNGGDGGNGGASTATASTAVISSSAEADAYSDGGSGGAGGGAGNFNIGNSGTGATGGSATAQSSARTRAPALSLAQPPRWAGEEVRAHPMAYPAPAGQEAELPLLQEVGQHMAP